MEFRELPICVFSFNRPAYLRRTLDSLGRAIEVAGMAGPVLLFQDGVHNRHSGHDKAAPEAISSCIAAFRAAMPRGVVFAAAENLGVGRNIHRGETWAFADNDYPAALFFEDDMVVSPRYFLVMARLHALALAQPRIAMFAAYGADGRATAAEQFENRGKIGPMHHNWAFCLTRDAWRQREILTRDYAALLEGRDYRDRPLDRIAAWYGTLGWPPLPTSQDIAKSVALNTLGLARVASIAVCARNIGEVGQHYTPEEFQRLGLADVTLLESAHPDADWEFDPVSDEAIDAIVAAQRQAILRSRLGVEAFLGSEGLAEALRILRAVGGAGLLRGGHTRYVTSASGLYPDRWCRPAATLAFSARAALRGVEIEAVAAQHLPPGTTLAVMLNGQGLAEVVLRPGQALSLVVPMPRHLDGLEKRLTLRCGVDVDPYSVGYNQDRRAISVLLIRLTVLERDGTRSVIEGEQLVELPDD